jgi:A/G-specific adenine glycosylase
LRSECAGFATGNPETFPVKAKKAPQPRRYGTMFWAERGGKVLLVRRPDKGLLGGMRALPTGPWTDAPPGLADAPFDAEWRMLETQASHVFTHFRLDCALAVATIGAQETADGEWWPIAELESAGLPTVFAKAAMTIRRERCG